MAFPTGQFVPPGYVPAMQQMQQMPQMLPQIQPSMQFHPSMLANPMATPQFTATPLKQPIFPRQAGVQQYDHSDSEISDDDDDDLDEDSDFDEPPELEPETMQHRTFLQATQFPARSRSGERGRSRSIPRESQCLVLLLLCSILSFHPLRTCEPSPSSSEPLSITFLPTSGQAVSGDWNASASALSIPIHSTSRTSSNSPEFSTSYSPHD
jgi:hypothetical protein